MKKTVEEIVDILMIEGIENPEKWMTISKYDEPRWQVNSSYGWASEWRKLYDHHAKESRFLLEVIDELRKRLLVK